MGLEKGRKPVITMSSMKARFFMPLTSLFFMGVCVGAGVYMQNSIPVSAAAADDACCKAQAKSPNAGSKAAILKLPEHYRGSAIQKELAEGVFYYRLQSGKMTAHLVSMDLNNPSYKVVPLIAQSRDTTTDLTAKANAVAGINAGYFNLTDGVSASYVTADGKQVLDPTVNKALVENPNLKPFLKQIFDRSELRIYEPKKSADVSKEASKEAAGEGRSAGDLQASIVAHHQPTPAKLCILHAMQGGPALLPGIRSEAEAFIRKGKDGKSVDAIGTTRKAARTAVGITSGGGIVFAIIEGSRGKEFKAGASLKDMAQLLKEVGCTAALNLDGGTSTTMAVRATADQLGLDRASVRSEDKYSVVFSNEEERKVKSALAIVPR